MSSAFLNLPAELRNQIYELVAASIPKVKIEASPILRYYAPISAAEVRADILNFDFASSMTYLKTLDSDQIRGIEHKYSIRIFITLDKSYNLSKNLLADWLTFCGNGGFQNPSEMGSYTFGRVFDYPGFLFWLAFGDSDEHRRTYGHYRLNDTANLEWRRLCPAWSVCRKGD